MISSVSLKLSRRLRYSASSSSLRRCSCSSASLSRRRRASRSAKRPATDRLELDVLSDMIPSFLRCTVMTTGLGALAWSRAFDVDLYQAADEFLWHCGFSKHPIRHDRL